jgi:hypothetical protein
MSYVFDEKKLKSIELYINELTDGVVLNTDYYFTAGCLKGILYDADDDFACELLTEIEKEIENEHISIHCYKEMWQIRNRNCSNNLR